MSAKRAKKASNKIRGWFKEPGNKARLERWFEDAAERKRKGQTFMEWWNSAAVAEQSAWMSDMEPDAPPGAQPRFNEAGTVIGPSDTATWSRLWELHDRGLTMKRFGKGYFLVKSRA